MVKIVVAGYTCIGQRTLVAEHGSRVTGQRTDIQKEAIRSHLFEWRMVTWPGRTEVQMSSRQADTEHRLPAPQPATRVRGFRQLLGRALIMAIPHYAGAQAQTGPGTTSRRICLLRALAIRILTDLGKRWARISDIGLGAGIDD